MGKVIRSLLLVLMLVSMALIVPGKAHASTPTPPFTQCPAIGLDTSCAILIVFNADGTINILSDGTQGPFDGNDDTLIGVQNNSGISIPNMTISGNNIFGFDGDGLCASSISPRPASCPFGSTGYEGPNTSFA